MIKAEELFEEIDSLPLEMKTRLIEKLLESINPSQKEIDELWKIEAEKRLKEIKDNTTVLIDGEEVFSEIRNNFSK